MSTPDPFCPRHGRSSRPIDVPGLRCDCMQILQAAVAPLKLGKWASAPLGQLISGGLIDTIQERINEVADGALLAGYRLGLAGGVERERVLTCPTCGAPFMHWATLKGAKERDEDRLCLTCWSAGRE